MSMNNTATMKKEIAKSELNRNVIALNNRLVYLPTSPKSDSVVTMGMVMSIQAELMKFGYMLDQSAMTQLLTSTKEEVIRFHDQTITYLKKMTGGVHSYRAFYPGFPQQVMEMSECDLWFNQIVHYLSAGAFGEVEWAGTKATAFEHTEYTVLKGADEKRFNQIFTDLVSVNQSLTPTDLETIKWFVNSGRELVFPEVIPFKENLCTLAGMGLDVPVKTATDVLRICVHMSGGDISLPKVPAKTRKTHTIYRRRWQTIETVNNERDNFKFKKFSNAERKYILSLLEKTNCDVKEMKLKAQRWIRLGEILHPGSYANKFPKVFNAFQKLRNEKVTSWYGEVNSAFSVSFETGLAKLSERPGELFRRLDWMVRTSGADRLAHIYNTIGSIANRVSNKVLFEAYTHFENRLEPNNDRTITIKGKRNKVVLPSLKAIKPHIVDSLQETILNAVKSKFKTLEPLGDCWIDPELKKLPMPTNMRSMNPALKPVVRGQRMPIGNQNAKTIRAFVHWFDEHGCEDLDLTGVFIGMGKTEHVGWNGTKKSKYGVYSGDVRHRQGACAEYVDINVEEALKAGFKYALIDVRNYQGRGLDTMKDCVAGFMEREHPEANMTWVPKTIANCQQLTSTATNTLVCAIDLETREYIMLDVDTDGIPVASANFDKIWASLKPYTTLPKLSVYDLLSWHVEARGGRLIEQIHVDEFGKDLGVEVNMFTFKDFSNSYVEILKYMGI